MAVPPNEESIPVFASIGGLAVQLAIPLRFGGCFFTLMAVRNETAKGSAH